MSLPLQFAPFSSSISPDFWHALTTLKLNVLKLSDDPVPVSASFTRGRTVKDRKTGEEVGLGCTLELDGNAFEADGSSTKASTSDRVHLRGILRNFNTIEDFKSADKTSLLDSVGSDVRSPFFPSFQPALTGQRAQIWKLASSGDSPSTTGEDLNSFLVLTFADLKKYRYWYWCGFPALLQKPGWESEGEWRGLEEGLDQKEAEAIHAHQAETKEFVSLARPVDGGGIEFAPLSSASTFFGNTPPASRTLIFLDPSSHSSAPGWPLRNVLSYLTLSHSISTIRIIAYRDTSDEKGKSRVATLSLKVGDGTVAGATKPGVVGWEKNDKGKLGPRMADLAPLMDPTRLADQAVDLNLQLMRWRIMPSLDLDKVSKTKVLLLGAGTLGCYVARTLMAWGVRKITLVDSSTVSFSNPVRQPLFEFEDSLGGGKPKAQAAAAALKRIYPGVDATGITLSIPMPGHPIVPSLIEQAKKDVKQLEDLIEEHDAVYLLMDSRESRWLPTVIGASKRKLVMTVALGFDTFLVMRHGIPPPASEEPKKPVPVVPGTPYEGQLGCYYCNDIVAPRDSLTDRTLDQMCTVTRPGIASIASSTAVELMVSILQHPNGSVPSSSTLSLSAPPTEILHPNRSSAHSDVPITSSSATGTSQTTAPDPSLGSPLGLVPHQIRGFLAQFHNMKITGQASDLCTACSRKIIDAYEKDGFEMLVQAFEDAKYLEKISGLSKMYEESEEMMESVDWDEEDDEAM
ncbi:ubiquitin-like modifier-activating enzyme ATG7, partial [Phenoliferia sp. Uapishka_3]